MDLNEFNEYSLGFSCSWSCQIGLLNESTASTVKDEDTPAVRTETDAAFSE
jgi:hypothetical protein